MSDYTAKIIHKGCRNQIGWYFGEKEETAAYAKDVELMDGTRPEPHEKIRIKCDCGETIVNPRQMYREFNV